MISNEESKPVQAEQAAPVAPVTPEQPETSGDLNISRRELLKGAGALAVAGGAVFSGTLGALGTNYAYAQGAGRIKIGWIGCGGRGGGAVRQSLDAAPEMLLWAAGDVFPKAKGARDGVARDSKYKDKVDCPDERCFEGFDNYKGVVDSGIDMIVHATPPGFRPQHVAYAVEKGKHVFSEKPFAVDVWGVQQILAAAKMADEKKLGIVAGTQRRHDKSYIETINKIKEGAIGDIVSGQCYWNQGGLWDNSNQFKPGMSDMEKQLINWYYYTWICGDHIVEQHIHNLDVMNWVIGAHPDSAVGMGGRQVRTDPRFGHIYDHFATELTYPGGIKVLSFARHQDATTGNVSEFIQGTKGTSNANSRIYVKGQPEWKAPGGGRDAYIQEHIDLVDSIKAGKPLNEGVQIAESTLTAIMCREACYTGKAIQWNQLLSSGQQLFQAKPEWGPLPTPEVAKPGRTMVKRADISQEQVDELKKNGGIVTEKPLKA